LVLNIIWKILSVPKNFENLLNQPLDSCHDLRVLLGGVVLLEVDVVETLFIETLL